MRLLLKPALFLGFGCCLTSAHSVFLDLRPLFNNKGIGTRPGEASFDGHRRGYPANAFAAAAPNGSWTSSLTGVTYQLPGYTGPRQPDNVVCGGQRLPLPDTTTDDVPAFFSLSLLVATDAMQQDTSADLVLAYSDGRRQTQTLRASPAWSFLTLSRGELVAPYTWTATGIDGNTSQVFEYTAPLVDSTAATAATPATLVSVTLPDTRRASARIHVFAASLWQQPWPRAAASFDENNPRVRPLGAGNLQVQNVRPTQKATDTGHQVVEITLNNAGPTCFSSGSTAASVSLEGDGVRTVEAGRLMRLCPGDQRWIRVGVANDGPRNTNMTVVVRGASNATQQQQQQSQSWIVGTARGRLGFEPYAADDPASLARHESPDWFDGAKYGIFIHWGPYAVPGYGGPPDRETYAEWFWWYSTHHDDGNSSGGGGGNQDPADTYGYRRQHFGRTWAYDDGFANFTADRWDPRAWVDLVAAAGATYFVLTTKHHDGFALFDTGATTNRSALHYGPRRDVLGDLFAAARTHQPALKRGTYFSMPEWFNPDFAPYGFGRWPGQLARNPFTGREEPYTGRRRGPAAVGATTTTDEGETTTVDYVRDLQLPQMRTLAYQYETDILWCDCGPASNATAAFIAEWWNGGPAATNNNSRSSRRNSRRSLRSSSSSTRAWFPHPRQPVVNSRCGLPLVADFETPEYATYGTAQRRKWEANRGMDPYSYGYNRATPASAYLDPARIVAALVDTVAHNGNLLLDIGPRADGSIVAAEAANLRAAGVWIRAHGEALYNTTYWWKASNVGGGGGSDSGSGSGSDSDSDSDSTDDHVRFTQTDDAFYVFFLDQPTRDDDGFVVVDAPVPILPGDTVSLLAVPGAEDLEWESRSGSCSSGSGSGRGGSLAVQVSADALAQEQYAWVFKIAYGGRVEEWVQTPHLSKEQGEKRV
ncbi:alpha-L-fucosidase [Niveomyces insectorum RCEF 264]|uniref:alpha-L-fucosidase n=1 Tax=Niveomyces insectorum RCEF 264 TaxID=1081102 RepID=A0A167QTW5_9HYPO|nr:alpha-L-fucosidase [Niveomyces insectorum RCEF 264]